MAEFRKFETGATRDTDNGKLKYAGFTSALVDKRFAQYMHAHRTLPDGSLRAADNWKQGIPLAAYADSLVRHTKDFQLHNEGFADEAVDSDLETVLCAIIFNANGYLFEHLKEKRRNESKTISRP